MRSDLLRALAVAIALLPAVAYAQSPLFRAPFPLTDTRYEGVREHTSDFFAPHTPILRSSGTEAVFFHFAEERLQVAKIVEGERRIPRPVFPFYVDADIDFDAVWTGSHFLVVAKDPQTGYQMYGRLVDASGVPTGEVFPIGELTGTFPRLAFNGRTVLLLYASGNIQSVVLTPEGRLTGAAPQEVTQGVVSGPPVLGTNGTRFAAIIWTGDAFDELYIFDENGRLSAQRGIESVAPGWAIGGDGQHFLAVNARGSEARALLLDPDGTPIATLPLDASGEHFHALPEVAWSGSSWIITTLASNTGRILEVDRALHAIVSTQTVPNTQVGVVERRGKVLALWWANRELLAHEIPFLPENGEFVGQQAAQQDLWTTTSTTNTTLVMWYEGGFRIGLRSRDGGWTERMLGVSPRETLLAASNGSTFVILSDTDAIYLSEEGDVIGGTTLPFAPYAVAWNGDHYGLLGFSGGSLVSSILGIQASEPFVLPFQPGAAASPRLSSNGSGFLAAWGSLVGECYEPPCAITHIHALALDAAMRPAGPVVTPIENSEITSYALAWNGDQYVFAHSARGVIHASDLTAAGAIEETRIIADERTEDYFYAGGISLLPMPSGGITVGWGVIGVRARFAYRSASLDRQGQLSAPVTIHADDQPIGLSRSLLTVLGDGRLAYVASSVQVEAPYHGSRRMMMSIADTFLSEAPEAPRATLFKLPGGGTLSWSRPNGTVQGFRVEQRIADDAWMEIGTWLDATQTELAVTIPAAKPALFRVRAFNDAGPGAYSAPVSTELLKRRAVR